MEKQKLVLIIAIIILIGVISVLSGYILGLNQNSVGNANNTTNNTTKANNTTVKNDDTSRSTSSQNTEGTNYIGESRAKQIAIDFLIEYGIMETAEIRSVDFVTINGVPLYRIMYYNSYVTAYGTETGWDEVLVGAKDGKFYDDSGQRITT